MNVSIRAVVCFLVVLYAGLPPASSGECATDFHFRTKVSRYVFSWLSAPNRTFTWQQARKYCKDVCMDMVSFDNGEYEWGYIKYALKHKRIQFIWTAGRKCTFKGCENPSFHPPISNGWFWASTKIRIPNPFSNRCKYCEWSPKGYLGGPQPDNREGITEGRDEGCLAILNNVYNDGIKWHDVACHHKKPVVCEVKV